MQKIANLVCQIDFLNDLTSICIVADADLRLEFGQSVKKFKLSFFAVVVISFVFLFIS